MPTLLKPTAEINEAMKEIRVGVIGIGNMGYAHAVCIAENGVKGMRLCAVCDISSDKIRSFEKDYPETLTYTDYNELLKSGEIDAVIIAVPHPLHSEIAIKALENGLHVMLEKPADITVSKVKKLNEKKVLTEEERAAKKKKYIEDAQVGTLVAFRTDTGRVKSAMIKKRSTSKRRFLLETNYGAKYKVSFDDILWVRTNKRWPKGIFQLLRGEKVETTKGE